LSCDRTGQLKRKNAKLKIEFALEVGRAGPGAAECELIFRLEKFSLPVCLCPS
jgi:hypothetical protein